MTWQKLRLNSNMMRIRSQVKFPKRLKQQMGKRQRCFCHTKHNFPFPNIFPTLFLKLSRVPNRGKALSAATTKTRGSETETETVEVEEDNHE